MSNSDTKRHAALPGEAKRSCQGRGQQVLPRDDLELDKAGGLSTVRRRKHEAAGMMTDREAAV
eukprot:1313665-Rhodomonas_salina.1